MVSDARGPASIVQSVLMYPEKGGPSLVDFDAGQWRALSGRSEIDLRSRAGRGETGKGVVFYKENL